jgi:hypothetical protein
MERQEVKYLLPDGDRKRVTLRQAVVNGGPGCGRAAKRGQHIKAAVRLKSEQTVTGVRVFGSAV